MGAGEEAGFTGGWGEHGKGQARTSRSHPVSSGSDSRPLSLLTVLRGLPECGAIPKIRDSWHHQALTPTPHAAPYQERAVMVPISRMKKLRPQEEGTEQRPRSGGWYKAGREAQGSGAKGSWCPEARRGDGASPGTARSSRAGRGSTREGSLGAALVPSWGCPPLPRAHIICVLDAQLWTLTS